MTVTAGRTTMDSYLQALTPAGGVGSFLADDVALELVVGNQ